MRYQIPPDVLHYEVRMIFGLSAQDIMLSGLAIILGIQKFGIAWGLLLGVLSLLALKRYERMGNRSPLVYLTLWAWNRYRPQRFAMPRVLPGGGGVHLEVTDWEGQPMYRLEDEA
jgi:hypothetical protein